MLRSLYALLDYHIAATDGVQGIVNDFLFDDESWIIHYLVAETAGPVGKGKVLILPFAIGKPDWEAKRLAVNLSSEQIRTSPPLESDMPISRQYEAGLKMPGSHLRSVREVLGYCLHTKDGADGSVEDFIIEDTLWGVHHAVVALKRPPFRSTLISPESIRSISFSEKSVRVNLSLREFQQQPDFDPAKPVNRDRQHQLYDFYGRPVYQPPPIASESRPGAKQP